MFYQISDTKCGMTQSGWMCGGENNKIRTEAVKKFVISYMNKI